MCGIIALKGVSEEISKKILKNLSLRGREGYGIYSKVEPESLLKSTKNVELLEEKDVVFSRDLMIANSRAIPTTEYEIGAGHDIINQQPFSSDRYVVVHNGIISNDKELIKTFGLEPTSKVDSAILPHLFEKVGVIEGMKLLKGSFAIICYDRIENKIYAGKNFMPLVYFEEDAYTYGFVSLRSMIEKELPSYTQYLELPNYSCMELDMALEEYKPHMHSLLEKKRNKKVLIICSSGIDSTTTAFVYKRLGYEVGLMHFKYGQAAQRTEMRCVKQIAKMLDAELFVYDAKKIFSPFKNKSKLLYQKKANATERMLDAESTLSYVPNRNAIMAMITAAYAEMNNYHTVSFGGQQMDSVYPDNNPGFVNAVDELLKYSLNTNSNVKFTAPLIHLIKHEIVELGQKIGINYDKYVCSCYYPTMVKDYVVHCHVCGCCQFRDKALEMVAEKKRIENVDEFITKFVEPFA